jgi:hypothetical protein
VATWTGLRALLQSILVLGSSLVIGASRPDRLAHCLKYTHHDALQHGAVQRRTWLAYLVKYAASSNAESPPPTTATSFFLNSGLPPASADRRTCETHKRHVLDASQCSNPSPVTYLASKVAGTSCAGAKPCTRPYKRLCPDRPHLRKLFGQRVACACGRKLATCRDAIRHSPSQLEEACLVWQATDMYAQAGKQAIGTQ